MSPWVYVFALATSVNAALAFMSRSDSAKNLAVWITVSFWASILIEKAEMPLWLLSFLGRPEVTVYGVPVPWQMVLLAALDAFLLFRYRAAARHDMQWAIKPLTHVQIFALLSHAVTVATMNQFDAVYYAFLDILFAASLVINGAGSVRGGLDLHIMFGHLRTHPDWLHHRDRHK